MAQTGGKYAGHGRQVLVAAVLLGVLALAGWWWLAAPAPAPDSVTATVERGDVEDVVTALGNLQPRDYVDVGAQVSGQLKQIRVAIGDSVKQGDLLAEIDPRILLARVEVGRAQLLSLRAQRKEAQARLELAQQQFQRQQALLRDDATSEDAYQASQAALRVAEAAVDALDAQILQAESTLKGDETTLGYTRIYAPMDGTVMSLTARQGQTLNANQQAPVILRIGDLSTMTVWTQVSEADVARLRIGMPAYFTTLGSGKRRWQGTLQQILPTPEVLNNVVLYTALFDVGNTQGELMAQMTAQVFFVLASARDVPLVPVAALRPLDAAGGRHRVTVLGTDGRLQEREITTGISNRVMAEVKAGLEAGERVLIGQRPVAGQAASAPGGPPAPRMQLGTSR